MQADTAFIRRHFPGLAGEWAYMDNAGGSQVLAGVADRVREFLLTTPVQHGASYAPSQDAARKVAEATAALARMLNAAQPDELVIGPSTTFLLQQLARGMAPGFRPGDEIVVTNVDHESNIGPWRGLEAQGVLIREWRIDPASHELDLEGLERLLGPRTRLVCVTHCSNVLGTIMPIAEIARLVHAAGAELCVDGVALAPHRRVDVQALGCDWYVYSFYKTYGPHQAVLWGRFDRLLELASLNHFFIGKDRVPYKLQPGNVNYELSYGCIGIHDYLCEMGTALGSQGTNTALIMLVIVLLANGLLQNIVQPIAFGATLKLNPLVVLVVTIAAGSLFGMIGLVLAAPLTSAAVHISGELSRARSAAATEP